jgi:hypothetical protein
MAFHFNWRCSAKDSNLESCKELCVYRRLITAVLRILSANSLTTIGILNAHDQLMLEFKMRGLAVSAQDTVES